LPSRTLASDVQPVHMQLLTADGVQVDGPQQLGTSLQLQYTLNGGDGKCTPVHPSDLLACFTALVWFTGTVLYDHFC